MRENNALKLIYVILDETLKHAKIIFSSVNDRLTGLRLKSSMLKTNKTRRSSI